MSVVVRQVYAYTSASRTATPSVAYVGTQGRTRLHLVIDVTSVTSTPSVVPTIDGYDDLSSKYYNLLTGVAITAVGTTVLKIGPGIGQLANVAAADVLPGALRITMTHADSNAITYTVNAILMG